MNESCPHCDRQQAHDHYPCAVAEIRRLRAERQTCSKGHTYHGERSKSPCPWCEIIKGRGKIKRLKAALSRLMCWAGESPDGPEWATPEAKARNRDMFNRAFQNACDCFPKVYVG
jgi:hypothetical protein